MRSEKVKHFLWNRTGPCGYINAVCHSSLGVKLQSRSILSRCMDNEGGVAMLFVVIEFGGKSSRLH